MSSSDFQRALSRFLSSVHARDGAAAAFDLTLRICTDAERGRVWSVLDPSGRLSGRNVHMSGDQSIWVSVFTSYVTSGSAEQRGKYAEAFEAASEAVDTMIKFIGDEASKDCNWWVPILNQCITRFRLAAYQADKQLIKQASKKNDVATTLQKIFGEMNRDRNPIEISKKVGLLFIVNSLFKIFIKLGNLRLCTPLIRNVQNSTFPPLQTFSIAETTCFYYYAGRLSLGEEKYANAMETLNKAFILCDPTMVNNKRRILEFLIPSKLLMGYFPKHDVLKKYKLTAFAALSQAIKVGDLLAWNAALIEHQRYFISKGLYLILDQTKQYVYRALFKRIYKAFGCIVGPDAKKSQLPLAYVIAGFTIAGNPLEIAEIECIAANLIMGGWMKGYIVHGKCFVLSNTNPFPEVFNVMKARYSS